MTELVQCHISLRGTVIKTQTALCSVGKPLQPANFPVLDQYQSRTRLKEYSLMLYRLKTSGQTPPEVSTVNQQGFRDGHANANANATRYVTLCLL